MSIATFHPAIQSAIIYFSNPDLSLADVGERFGISKQGAAKRIELGRAHFAAFGAAVVFPERAELERAREEIDRLNELVSNLRRQLVIHGVVTFLLTVFKEAVQKFFPNFKVTRLTALQKLRVLQFWGKYERLGGKLKDFCHAAERSPETLRKWLEAYKKLGLNGLYDKTSRPRHFSNRIPVWLRDQLLVLFLRFPEWTPYQYHKYINGHPAMHYAISLPTIAKLKAVHVEKTAAEKERIKKRWAFAPGSDVWTMDFTCILKTDRYKLQLLTVSDAASRFFFETALFLDTSTDHVIDHLEELFIKYGKPKLIKADNGPEFRVDCREELANVCVHLLNSPYYYGQFCGAHERIHRTMKTFIDEFASHCNLQRLVADIARFRDDHNYRIPLEILDMKTPSQVFFCEEGFVPKDVEVVTPYEKDGELRMKFTNRDGKPARMGLKIDQQSMG